MKVDLDESRFGRPRSGILNVRFGLRWLPPRGRSAKNQKNKGENPAPPEDSTVAHADSPHVVSDFLIDCCPLFFAGTNRVNDYGR